MKAFTYFFKSTKQYEKPTANIVHNSGKLSFSSRISNKARTPTLTTCIEHNTESPSESNQAGSQAGKKQKEKERKRKRKRKEKEKRKEKKEKKEKGKKESYTTWADGLGTVLRISRNNLSLYG